jgi:hypothetical protein
VNVSPSVVTVWGLFSPTGTDTVFVPQTSTPLWDVTIWPSGRVVVKAGGRISGVEVIALPSERVVVETGGRISDVEVIALPSETVVMLVTLVVDAPRFPDWLPPDEAQEPSG